MKRLLLPIISAIILAAITFVALNNVKKTSNNLYLKLQVEVLKDDIFQVFYKHLENRNFSEKRSIKSSVKGSPSVQEVIFKLPTTKPIQEIRIDIGHKRIQEKIRINDICLKSENKVVCYNLLKDFKSNKYVKTNGDYIGRVTVNGIYDPYFISKFDVLSDFNLLMANYNYFPKWLSVILSIIVFLSCLFALYFQNIKVSSNSIFILAFALILIIPSSINFFDVKVDSGINEKRILAEMPKFEFTEEFAKKYEAYYKDNFGLRNALVGLNSSIKTNMLKISPRPEMVLFGKDGFLFYNAINDAIYNSYTKRNTVDERLLENSLNKQFKIKKDLASKNIDYIIGFWPNKHTIYPEHLPWNMELQVLKGSNLSDQIVTYFQQNGLKIVDVRKRLLVEKQNQQLFFKFDTHWNSYGAYFAYQEFCIQTTKELNLSPFTLEDFNIDYSKVSKGDLTNMLGIKKMEGYSDKSPNFVFRNLKEGYIKLDTKGFPQRTVITENKNIDNNETVIVFRDSFSTYILPFLSLHYRKVVYIWSSQVDYKLIEKVKPDVVMKLSVERYMGSFL